MINESLNLLLTNLLSPLPLAFLIGMAATLLKSELEFPAPVLNAMSIYLVFAIALKGGTELAAVGFAAIIGPALVCVALALLIPAGVYWVARRWLRLDIANAAGLAALYGSVSSVTFLAAMTFAAKMGHEPEPFMPVLVSILEWAILVALFIARWRLRQAESAGAPLPLGEIVRDTLRGRSVILMLGGLAMGWLIGESGFKSVKLVFEDAFRGILVLFLLEMGMVAARQLREFVALGYRIVIFGVCAPLIHGMIGCLLGTAVGLSLGGSFVLGAITASASYIDAPAAVRATLPQANPSIYLTSSLGITFPFNLLVGLPLLFAFAQWVHS